MEIMDWPFFPGLPLENFKGLPQDQVDQLKVDIFIIKVKGNHHFGRTRNPTLDPQSKTTSLGLFNPCIKNLKPHSSMCLYPESQKLGHTAYRDSAPQQPPENKIQDVTRTFCHTLPGFPLFSWWGQKLGLNNPDKAAIARWPHTHVLGCCLFFSPTVFLSLNSSAYKVFKNHSQARWRWYTL